MTRGGRRSGVGVLLALLADRGDHVYFGGDGPPGLGLRCGCVSGWRLVPLVLLALAGLVVGVGEAGIDGVVQVEALAVPGGDDRLGGDDRVVAVVDGAV